MKIRYSYLNSSLDLQSQKKISVSLGSLCESVSFDSFFFFRVVFKNDYEKAEGVEKHSFFNLRFLRNGLKMLWHITWFKTFLMDLCFFAYFINYWLCHICTSNSLFFKRYPRIFLFFFFCKSHVSNYSRNKKTFLFL